MASTRTSVADRRAWTKTVSKSLTPPEAQPIAVMPSSRNAIRLDDASYW